MSEQSNDYVNKEEWVDPTSEKVNKILIDLSLGGNGGSKPNGKDDEEPYFFEEEIKYEEGKGMVLKIQLKPINMRAAANRVERGGDVMTLRKDWCKELFVKVSRENGASMKEIRNVLLNPKKTFENHHPGEIGHYDHMHPLNQKTRPHITLWKKL